MSRILSNQALIQTFQIAKELGLDPNFIELLRKEIIARGLNIKHEPKDEKEGD